LIYPEHIAALPKVDDLFERIGWQVDQLMSIDTRGKGIIPPLYQAAREWLGKPLAMTAARALRERIKPGDVVGIITGFPSRSFLGRGITETDGPVGAVFLARVLEEVLNAVIVRADSSSTREKRDQLTTRRHGATSSRDMVRQLSVGG
jgi:hypothetical protein